MSIFPHSLGWNAHTAASWDALPHPPLSHPARVVRVDRGLVTVVSDQGELRLPLAGKLRQDDLTVAVGDWAVVAGDAIVGVLPRRTALLRRDVDGSSAEQVIAANVDVVVVAVPLTEPVRVRKLERYLAFARSSGAEALVVLTKCDLWPEVETALADAESVAGGAGVHAVSAVTGEGVDDLLRELRAGSTVVVVGPSGAGKSTLANALGAERQQATGAIRDDGKGRHTTTARELVRVTGGALLIDTPGLRGLALFGAEEGIDATFADVAELAEHCRFTDCGHRTEPGCAVIAAIADGRLTIDRLEAHAKLQREEQWLAAKVDSRAQAERTKQRKALTKSRRGQHIR